MKGFDYMAGFVGPETRVIAPPIPDTPRIADYFKTGKSLSATFKEYDEAMEAFLRSMAQYLNVESFDPAINSGGSSTSQVQSALGAVYPWVQYPIFQDGKIDYENGTWSGSPSGPPFTVYMERIPGPALVFVGEAAYFVVIPDGFHAARVTLTPRSRTPFVQSEAYFGRSQLTNLKEFVYHLYSPGAGLVVGAGGALAYDPNVYVPADWIHVQLI